MGDAASRQLDDHAHSRKRQDRTKHVSGKGLFVIWRGGGTDLVRVGHLAVAGVAAAKRAALLEEIGSGRGMDSAIDAAAAH
jgi:hypothetical protein